LHERSGDKALLRRLVHILFPRSRSRCLRECWEMKASYWHLIAIKKKVWSMQEKANVCAGKFDRGEVTDSMLFGIR
jgi:hypothetical protein